MSLRPLLLRSKKFFQPPLMNTMACGSVISPSPMNYFLIVFCIYASSRCPALGSQSGLVNTSARSLPPFPSPAVTKNESAQSSGLEPQKSRRAVVLAPLPADAFNTSDSGISAVAGAVADASFSPELSNEPAISGTQNQLEETEDLPHKTWECYFSLPPDAN